MNNSRSKRIPKIILGQLLAIAIMVFLGISILFYAEGYRVNWKTLKIIKTGVIYLSSYPKQADVYLDGVIENKKTPFTKSLLPGYYYVAIKKEGYQDWYSSFKIEKGLVRSYKSLALFKSEIKPEALTDQGKIDLINSPSDDLINPSGDRLLVNNDYEIWQGNNLITRFSEPISGARWYSDQEHIFFQQSNEIRIIDKDGNNNILLITLKAANPTNFAISSNGSELYFYDSDGYYFATIR